MAAAGLKKGEVLAFADMGARCQQLLSSGMFATVAFKFDGQDLIFSLAPSPELYPIRLDNLPLTPGADLDAKLHQQLPLYHGKVPGDGGLMDGVRLALEKILADQGISASVTATTAGSLGTHKLNAVVYSITSPPVLVGPVKLNGVSARLQPEVQRAVAEIAKLPFDTANSAGNLGEAVERVYRDEGYAAVKVQVSSAGAPVVAAGGIQMPFSIDVEEGRVYKVAAIHLPEGAPVTQAEVDKIMADPAIAQEGVRIRTVWTLLSSRYKARGYLDCAVTPHAALNDANGTVSYNVDVVPGPVYHLGFVKFDNVSDPLRAVLIHYWQMMPGDVFDESYVSQFLFKAEIEDAGLRRSLMGVKESFDATADPQTHQVNVVIRLSR